MERAVTKFWIELIRRRELAPGVFELEFTRPGGLSFRPGQHIRIGHGAIYRDYTPVSASADPLVRICVKRVRRPVLSAYLSECGMGERFEACGPYGHFIFRPAGRPSVFVGTGTGVAPFTAFVRSGISGDFMLHGGSHLEGLLYRKILRAGCRTYIPCISRAAAGDAPAVFRGRVTDYLASRLPEGPYQFYLCGRREMILDALKIIDERFPDARVFTERFT